MRLLIPPALLCLVLICGCTKNREASGLHPANQQATPTEVRLRAAIELHQRGQTARALQIVQDILIESPEDPEALGLAVEMLSQLGRFCEAGELATKIAEVDRQNAARILIRGFDWQLRCGDFTAAEGNLNRAVELDPNDVQVRRLLAQLLNAQGRRYEASKHVRQLIRLRSIEFEETLSLIDLQGPFLLVSFDDFIDGADVSLFALGTARTLYVRSNTEPKEVLSLLERVTEKFPNSAAAAAFRGRILAETGRRKEFSTWLTQLPTGIEQQPEYWSAIGMWLKQQDRHDEAIRAFGEALRRDPTDRESLRAMIQALVRIGKEDQVTALRDRLAVLDQIFRIAKDADELQSRWISERLQELTRPWESAAWLMHAARLGGKLQQQVPELNMRHAAILAWEQDATAERVDAARLERMLGFKIERWPVPRLDSIEQSATQESIADLTTGLHMEDVAEKMGIATQFVSGFPVDGGELRTYQVNGGGLAALDYDLDGRCDVYVVQSGGRPNDPLGSTANQLFRLLPNQHFVEVTVPSATGDRSLGQGVCAGDANQDGFPDLLVANIGANVLYLNQGDGTFREASELIKVNPNTWTSCLALADLDGDNLPEIIEINYIDDSQAYAVRCQDDHLACQPQRFNAASDRVLQCLNDGTFAPWSSASKMQETPKLGFGVIIANFDRQHGNDFFIANDGDLNHYWISSAASETDGERFAIVESASVRGCSIGRGGDSQACMGVASGDFNRDGTLDLHITNFHNEPVNLFLQTQSGFFSDEALKYRLVEPSFGVLGFGTQGADFDNDGWLDLAVLNGHVFDARDEGIPFRMQPQLLRGSRQGFALQDPNSAGKYWQRNRLGRTLAMLDWNRDGRIDLIGNHLDVPVALLQNDSPAQNWLQLELVGVTGERDAIGAEVRIEAGGELWTGWQTGGDGYMCTNEPIIHFGLGQAESVDRFVLTWPTGQVQVFRDLKLNSRYLVIENEQELFRRW